MGADTGFHRFSHRRVVGSGDVVYAHCVSELFSGRAHRRAGAPLTGPFTVGGVVRIRPLGIRSLTSPCRILRRETGERHAVLVYVTLPGHLEDGEETFLIELLESGEVQVTVSAFSRPAHWLTHLGGPVALAAQRLMARRYVREISRPRPRPVR